MMDSTLHYTSVSHSGSLMATINKMRVNSDLCDVTLVVGDYRIMAHRIILSASAPFFYQMLQLQSQSHNENNNEVQLNNIDEIAALKIIEFCYTSAISLDDDTVWPLLAASIKFQLSEICTFCCEFLVAGLDTSNCILSLRLAAKVHCPQLEEKCVRFLLENIDQACYSHGLTSSSTPELYSLLSILALHDVGPATMAKLVSVWMDANRDSRQDSAFTQLLQVFPNMAPYLHQFSQHKSDNVGARGTVTHREEFKRKGTPVNINRFEGNSSSSKNGKQIGATGEQITPSSSDTEQEMRNSTSKNRCGFGIGASREFICISCGDDFDCEEDLLVHQNECDESARMVGSASGDSLRDGLMGGRKAVSSDGGDLNGKEAGCGGEEVVNDDTNNIVKGKKRKMDKDDSVLANDTDCKMGKMASGGDGNENMSVDENDGASGKDSENGSEQKEILGIDGGSRARDLEVNGVAKIVEEGKVNSKDDDKVESDRNDDNNNAINRLSRGAEKDKHEACDIDSKLRSRPDIVPSIVESDVVRKADDDRLPLPRVLSSSSSTNTAEIHFKTKRFVDMPGCQDRNRYSSSCAGLSSSLNTSSSSSSSSSIRPQQKCQICGRSFWERKQLTQHWVLDHGVRGKAGTDDINDEEPDQVSPYHHLISKAKQSPPSKLISGKEIQTDITAVQVGTSPWPFGRNFLGGQGSVMDSLFRTGSAGIRKTQASGWDDPARTPMGDSTSTKSLTSKMMNPTEGELSVPNGNDLANESGSRRHDFDRSLNEQLAVLGKNFKSLTDQSHGSNSRSSSTSFVKEEQKGKNREINESDLKLLAAAGNFGLPTGSQSLTSNEFLTNYLNQYHKLAQWCIAQGPNFCPACLVYHTSENPCPRSQNNLSSTIKSQSYSASEPDHSHDDKDKIKEEKVEVEEEEEDKEVNVDGVDEEGMEEGPLDMSKSSLELSAGKNNNNNDSNTSPGSSSSNQIINPIQSSQHNSHQQQSNSHPPSSSSTPLIGGIPPYYGYGHFLSGNSIMDMSAAAMKAAVAASTSGALGDLSLIPRQSPVQDLTSGISREHCDQQQNYNSYLHHHNLSASAIAAQSSMANNSNINNSNGLAASTAAFSSMVARSQNGGVGSSASSPSSIFSFPSSPPNPNAASSSSSSLSSSLVVPQSIAGGKKKSNATGVPPKQGFSCSVCNRVYSHQSALFTHMRSHSPSARSYRCQFCNETFARAPDLKVHVCPNGIEKPFTCPSCGQTFAKNIHLKRHLATHSGLKPYPCWVCGKRFSRSDHLKRHTQSIHAGARPHACHICGKEFVRKYELNKHMTSHN